MPIKILLPLLLTHAAGFHKRTVLTVRPRELAALVTLDVDGGKRCRLLRDAADANRNGRLDDQELATLRAKLVELAQNGLEASVASYGVQLKVRQARLSAKGDRQVSETGLSVALLLSAELPEAISPGMTLIVKDTSPDKSHIALEVFQAGEDSGAQRTEASLTSGEQLVVRLTGK